MEINILSVTIETIPTAKGSYQKAAVAYKDKDGKVTGKNIVSFVYPKVWEAISNAVGGDRFDVKNEKVKDNWAWTEITKLEEGQSGKPTSTTSVGSTGTKSTYETPEERAQKQICIVRQSSISNAIEYAVGVKAVKSLEELLSIAKRFENYVFNSDGSEFAGTPIVPLKAEEIE